MCLHGIKLTFSRSQTLTEGSDVRQALYLIVDRHLDYHCFKEPYECLHSFYTNILSEVKFKDSMINKLAGKHVNFLHASIP